MRSKNCSLVLAATRDEISLQIILTPALSREYGFSHSKHDACNFPESDEVRPVAHSSMGLYSNYYKLLDFFNGFVLCCAELRACMERYDTFTVQDSKLKVGLQEY